MADTQTKPFKYDSSKGITDDDKRKEYEFVCQRIQDLQKVRENVYGTNLDKIWDDADKDYIPHRLKTSGTKATVQNEEGSWRGTSSMVTLGGDNWQADFSASNVFVKIQVALATLVDQNPTGVFTPTLKKFEAATSLIRQLYDRSWRVSKAIYQLKLFVFNLSKYGWAIGRSYPLKIEREVKVLVEYNEEEPDKSVYETKKVIEYNDVFRENLDPRNCWIDDMAKPNNAWSVRDWAWRKVYTYDDAKVEFGKHKSFDQVPPEGGGITSDTITSKGKNNQEFKSKKLVEVYFYENRVKDIYHVHIAGVPVIMEPLPIAARSGAKKLSCWQTYWMLRHAECPYGVGMYEAIRYNQALLDRLRNMTLDQLTLSIYKMFFYQGTQNLQETGEIKITPGVGKQVIDPKGINWLETPGPGQEAWLGQEKVQKDIDTDSAVTDPLLGVVTGKTAFELAQAKESALKRLKVPFDNILEALENEGYITLAVMQLIYSIPEVYDITDERLIEDYIKETGGDPMLHDRKVIQDDNGQDVTKFSAKVYPEFPLNLEQDDKGNLIETQKTQFFRIKPTMLDWEGIINIKAQSILTPSKQIDKAMDLEFYNMFIPLITQMAEERAMGAKPDGSMPSIDELPHGKTGKELAKLYDKDPRDVFPTSWFESDAPQVAQQDGQTPQDASNPLSQLITQASGTPPPGGQDVATSPTEPQDVNAPTAVASPNTPTSPTGLGGKLISRLIQPLRR